MKEAGASEYTKKKKKKKNVSCGEQSELGFSNRIRSSVGVDKDWM